MKLGADTACRHDRLPAWTVPPWDSSQLDAREHRWTDVGLPYRREVQDRAATRTTSSPTRPR